MITNPNYPARLDDNIVPGSPRVRLDAWVSDVARLTKPDKIVWCDGSDDEGDRLAAELVDAGKLTPLNHELRPHSYLARTSDDDMSDVTSSTFTCSKTPIKAGPTSQWRDPDDMRTELEGLFKGSMRGRTMYVVPFSVGPAGNPLSQLGVKITDSAYVVLSMRPMTRLGARVLREIGAGTSWVATVHSLGFPLRDDAGVERADVHWPSNETKSIVRFTDTHEIWSYGSGHSGNAVVAKEFFELHMAAMVTGEQVWPSLRMLLLRITSPENHRFSLAVISPAADDDHNLATPQPPTPAPGWKVEMIGNDTAWLKPGSDGRLHVMNPEMGISWLASGTSIPTDSAVEIGRANTIFTNVALTDDGDVWWEGLTPDAPDHLVDWRGNDWTPTAATPASHPHSRFTVPIGQNPLRGDEWQESFPLDAILFGGHNANAPLVAEARDWPHGVFVGAIVSSAHTVGQGTVSELPRDPSTRSRIFTDRADYWARWLEFGETLGRRAPAIFHLNWSRTGDDGTHLWPGFEQNPRVLEWIVRRVEKRIPGVDTPIGKVPRIQDLNVEGLNISPSALEQLFEIDPEAWLVELDWAEKFLAQFSDDSAAAFEGVLRSIRYGLKRAAENTVLAEQVA